MQNQHNKISKKKFFKIFGPGLVTGAADDDPSGIATYSQAGAQFGYGQLWTVLFMLPLMTAIQEACARIGQVTGKGIVAVAKEHYGKKTVIFIVSLVLIANTINIGADIGAMAAATQLIVPIPFIIIILFFTALILFSEIFTSYKTYSRILKWLTISLLAYLLTVLIVDQPWITVLKSTFIPHVEWSYAFFFMITAILGTTISPYMFFWEANQEVEEEKEKHLIGADGKPKISWKNITSMRVDNAVGMIASEIAAWCIILTSATVLYSNGVTDIETSAEAAMALEPLVRTFPDAGFIAKIIFSVGVVGLGLIAVPVLAGSASYAVAEAFNWRAGLNYKFKKAHGFYGVITVATVVGLAINFIGIDPFKALIVTSVINAVVSIPLIFFIARIAGNKNIMGEFKSGLLSNVFVWMTFAVITCSVFLMFFMYFV